MCAHAGLQGASVELLGTNGALTECPGTSGNNTHVQCTIPTMTAGSYRVRVLAPSGYGHPALQVLNAPRIVSVEPPAGSLAGGQVVTVTTANVPLATVDGQTRVRVNGLPCQVISVEEGSVKCMTQRAFAALPTKVSPRVCAHCAERL